MRRFTQASRAVVFVVVLFGLSAGVAEADIIIDGAFNNGFTSWSNNFDYSGTGDLGSPDAPAVWGAAAAANEWISQTTSHVIAAGDQYTVSWKQAQTEVNRDGYAMADLCWDDGAGNLTPLDGILSRSLNLVTDYRVWQAYSFEYTAVAGQPYIGKALAFRWGNDENGSLSWTWAGVDSVVLNVAPIPEPSTLVLIATGLIGLLAYAWRKRR